MYTMSESAKVILLLCGHLGGPSDADPLDQRGYNQVVRWLLDHKLRPADLLSPEHTPELARGTGLDEQRLSSLLKRGVKLGFAVEKWNQSGIWVLCRSDPDYPARFKTHLKEKAPPVLFGTGERSLLAGGGLAVVGSRNVDAEGEVFAREVAAWCARGGLPVVSGGAKGVDQIAMSSALEAGGTVVGILADTLLKRSVSSDARYALSDGRLLLLSPYHPEAGFNVGNAMGRNKLIYALADYGLVVSADHNKGGTWEGATEELKRTPSRPVFVRLTGCIPKGNQKLVELGAIAFPSFHNNKNPAELLSSAAIAWSHKPQASELPLFDHVKTAPRKPSEVCETPPVTTQIQTEHVASSKPDRDSPATVVPESIYAAVLPVLIAALDKPLSVEEIASRLDESKAPMQKWLKRAVEEKKIRKLNKPVRYIHA
jgi:predicted Rossmann fold nucleotide-binding protein DprA/Smf involved in DNA uptake